MSHSTTRLHWRLQRTSGPVEFGAVNKVAVNILVKTIVIERNVKRIIPAFRSFPFTEFETCLLQHISTKVRQSNELISCRCHTDCDEITKLEEETRCGREADTTEI